jgi:hypothetical protein
MVSYIALPVMPLLLSEGRLAMSWWWRASAGLLNGGHPKSPEPGGRLIVVGISREARADLPWSIASLILNPIVGAVVHPRRSSKIPTQMTAPTAMAAESIEEIALTAERILPGARLRRGLFWRYTLSWTVSQGRSAETDH